MYSLFSNTDMAAKGLPKGKEKAINGKSGFKDEDGFQVKRIIVIQME